MKKIDYKSIFFIGINVFTIILLGSKAAVLTLITVFFVFLINKGLLKTVKGKLFAFMSIVIFLTIFFLSGIYLRFEQAINTVLDEKNSNELLSTGQRIQVWKNILELPLERLLLGNGNIHGYALLNQNLDFKLNSHNQYLEVLLASGLLGIILLFVFLFGLIFLNKQLKNNMLFVFFLLIIIINLAFENLLNRQWGIVFIGFFYSYLYVFVIKKDEYQ